MDLNYDLTLESNLIKSQFLLSDEVWDKAVHFALHKLGKWASTRITREFAKSADIPVGILRHRFYKSVSNGKISLWWGLDRIRVVDFGRVRQTRQGVTARGHLFRSAFMATMRTGYQGVFRRVTVRSLPIKSVYHDITTDEDIQVYLESIRREVEIKYGELLTHEIRYLTRLK